jgi:peptidoglycan hydrolase CwlO-like protein
MIQASEADNTDLRECVQALEDEHHARVATIDDQKVEINKLCEALRFSEDEANHLADEIIRHRQCREQAENDRNALQSGVDWLHRKMESQDEAAKFLQARVSELQGTVSSPSLKESHDDQQKRLVADTSALRAS